MNRLTRIIVATVIGLGLSRVMPADNSAKADVEAPELHPIVVSSLTGAPTFKWSSPSVPYLDSLRTHFDLDAVTAPARNDYERVRALSRWARTQWDQDGVNAPGREDPSGLLEDAASGEQVPCEEYATVLSGALNSMGLPARIVNLKKAGSDVRASGAGHTITEAYLRDAKRWVMVDGQYDVVPTVHGKPVSAFELKKAITGKSAGLVFHSMSGTHPVEYGRWIAQYLYFMDTRIDQRVGVVTDGRALMLLPKGERPLRSFQREALRNMIYTTAPAVFYPTPAAVQPVRAAG